MRPTTRSSSRLSPSKNSPAINSRHPGSNRVNLASRLLGRASALLFFCRVCLCCFKLNVINAGLFERKAPLSNPAGTLPAVRFADSPSGRQAKFVDIQVQADARISGVAHELEPIAPERGAYIAVSLDGAAYVPPSMSMLWQSIEWPLCCCNVMRDRPVPAILCLNLAVSVMNYLYNNLCRC